MIEIPCTCIFTLLHIEAQGAHLVELATVVARHHGVGGAMDDARERFDLAAKQWVRLGAPPFPSGFFPRANV